MWLILLIIVIMSSFGGHSHKSTLSEGSASLRQTVALWGAPPDKPESLRSPQGLPEGKTNNEQQSALRPVGPAIVFPETPATYVDRLP